MPTPVSNSDVEDTLREALGSDGYCLSRKRRQGETGVDIVARQGDEVLHIEAIGYKKNGPARAKDFYEVFFRIVSRLDNGAEHCFIALSNRAEIGLPARARQHGTAWRRIADAFPELEIWLVDTVQGTYSRRTWGEWADME